MDGDPPHFGNADSLITIDITAIVKNWLYLDSLSSGKTETAAVVKANAYGLGAADIAPALAVAGCRTFFVMSLAEAAVLRSALAEAGFPSARIFTLSGCHPGQQAEYIDKGITPVINSFPQLERWRELGRERSESLPAALHIDTAMNRLGLDAHETDRLFDLLETNHDWLRPMALSCLMSHLAAGEDLADIVGGRARRQPH